MLSLSPALSEVHIVESPFFEHARVRLPNMAEDTSFALESIVAHYDVAQANQDAVITFLRSLGLGYVPLELEGGLSSAFEAYIRQPPAERGRSLGLKMSSTSQNASVQNVAIVLALANVRAAADSAALPAASELFGAIPVLERLLLPLNDSLRACLYRPELAEWDGDYAPASRLVQSASLTHRRRRRTNVVADRDRTGIVSRLLLSISGSLRLCDIAAHVLAVTAQGNMKNRSVCASALEMSRRLLSLAMRLPRDEKSLSSLKAALECACFRVGAIAIEHGEIDPAEWIDTALAVMNGSSRVHVALFGGMIRGSQSYAEANLDVGSIVRAATTLSTLLIALENDDYETVQNDIDVPDVSTVAGFTTSPIAKAMTSAVDDDVQRFAALDFLGERVVAVEDDGHDIVPSISPWSSLATCDAYCEQAGHSQKTFGLVLSLLSAASRQCSAEVVAETDVVRPVTPAACEGESFDDAATPSGTPRSEAQFPIVDIFDSRSPSSNPALAPPLSAFSLTGSVGSNRVSSGLSTGACASTAGGGHANAHREVGALALDSLSLVLGKSSLADKGVILDGILTACEAATKLSCLSFLKGSSSLDARQEPRDGSSSLRGGSTWTSREEQILHASIEEFGDQAAKWMWRANISEQDFDMLASRLASGNCTVEVVGRVLSFSSSKCVAGAVVRAFVSRLLSGADDVAEKARSTCSHMEGLCASLRFVSTSFSMSSMPAHLNLILDLVDDSLADRGNLPSIVTAPQCETLALIALAMYGLRYLIYGGERAGAYLGDLLAALNRSLLEEEGDFDFDSFRGDDCSPAAGVWNLVDHSQLSTDVNVSKVCARFVRVFSGFADSLISKRMDLPIAWNSRGVRQVDKRCHNDFAKFQLAARLSLNAVKLARLYCNSALVDSDALFLSHCASSPVNSGAAEELKSDFPFMRNLRVCSSATFLPFTGVLHAQCASGLPGEESVVVVIQLASTILRSSGLVNLGKIIELDLAALIAAKSFRAQTKPVSWLHAAGLSEIFNSISRCVSALNSDLTFPRSRSAPTSVRCGDKAEADAARSEVAGLGIRIIRYVEACTSGSCADVLELVLESLGSLLDCAIRHDATVYDCRTIRDAAMLAANLQEAEFSFEGVITRWIRNAVQVTGGVSSAEDREFCCTVIIRGCRFATLIANAQSSRKDMDKFLTLLAESTTTREDLAEERMGSVDIASSSIVLSGNYDLLNATSRSVTLGSIPSARLDGILADLVIPADDSAVCVDAAARALSLLSVACEASPLWSHAVSSGLERLSGGGHGGNVPSMNDVAGCGEEQFCERLCRRSIVHSVTMSAAILQFAKAAVVRGDRGKNAEFSQPLQASSHRRWDSQMLSSAVAVLDADGHAIDFDSFCRVVEFCGTMACLSEHGRHESNGEACHVAAFLVRLSSVARMLSMLETSADSGEIVDAGRKVYFLVSVIDGVRNRVLPRFFKEDGVSKTEDISENADTGSSGFLESADGVFADLTTEIEKSARAELSQKLCTFSSTGSQFVEQHWYFCYTCDLTGTEGVCAICAQVCHAGHDLSYSRHSRFFCDCGEKTSKNGPSGLLAPPTAPSQGDASRLPVANGDGANGVASAEKDGDSRVCVCLRPRSVAQHVGTEDGCGADKLCSSSTSAQRHIGKSTMVRIVNLFPTSLHENCDEHDPTVLLVPKRCISSTREALSQPALTSALVEVVRCLLGRPSEIGPGYAFRASASGTEIQGKLPRKAVSGLFSKMDFKKIPAFSGNRNADSKRPGSVPRDIKLPFGSRVSFSPKTGLIAVAEVDKKVSFYRTRDLSEPTKLANSTLLSPPLKQLDVPFAIRSLQFDSETGGAGCRLVISGAKEILGYTVGREGDILSQVDVPLGFASGDPTSENVVLRAQWLLGERNHLLVVTRCFVKMFDLSEDSLSPAFFAELEVSNMEISGDVLKEDETAFVADAVVCRTQRGSGVLFVLSSAGIVSQFELTEATRGPLQLQVEERLLPTGANPKYVSLGVSQSPSLLWAICDDGSLTVLSPNAECARQYESFLPLDSCCELAQVPTHDSLASMTVVSTGDNKTFVGLLRLEVDGGLLFQDCKNELTGGVEDSFIIPAGIQSGHSQVPLVGLVIEDGGCSVLRVRLRNAPFTIMPEYLQKAEEDMLSEELADLRVEMRLEKFEQSLFDCRADSVLKFANVVPSVVGFIETSREVTSNVTVGGDVEKVLPPLATKSKSRRPLSLGRAGENRATFKNTTPGKPLKVAMTCGIGSSAMVGVRVSVGATDNSRNHAPGEIRVFGRRVRWSDSGGTSKRYIDIPFTIPEAVESPNVALLELYPRKKADGTVAGNGTVIVDGLEVYAVTSRELASRKRKLEIDMMAFNQHVRQALSSTRGRHLHDGSLLARHGKSCLLSDLWTSSLLSCLSALSAAKETTIEDFNVFLRCELDLHTVQVVATAVERHRSALSPCDVTCALLGSAHRMQLLAHRADDFSHESFGVSVHGQSSDVMLSSRCEYVSSFLSRSIRDPVRAGESISVILLEKVVFLLSKLLRACFESGQRLKCDEVVALLAHDVLEAICTALVTSRRSDDIAIVSRRELCRNVIDILFYALESWPARISRDPQDRQNLLQVQVARVVERCMVPLLTSPCQWMRFYSYRRVVDIFQLLGSPEEFASAGDVWFRREGSEDRQDSCFHLAVGALPDMSESAKDADDDDGTDRWTFKCDVCDNDCEPAWWHCPECGDFDLCKDCVALPASEMPSPHLDSHLLLRGMNDDIDSTPLGDHVALSGPCVGIRDTFGSLVTSVMKNFRESGAAHGIQLLESAQLLHRLVSAPSIPTWRNVFLHALFDSKCGLEESLHALIGRVQPDDWASQGLWGSLPSSHTRLPGSHRLAEMESLFVLIRMLASLQDVAAVPHILQESILDLVSTLLCRLLPVVESDMELACSPANTFKNSQGMYERGGHVTLDTVPPDIADTQDVPRSLLRLFPSEIGTRNVSSVFGHTIAELSSSAALEMVETILELLYFCFASVAGSHFERASARFNVNHLCRLKFYGDNVRLRGKEFGVASHFEAKFGLRGGRLGDLYIAVADKAQSLLGILLHGSEGAIVNRMDEFVFDLDATSLRTMVLGKESDTEMKLGTEPASLRTVLDSLWSVASVRPSNWRNFLRLQIENASIEKRAWMTLLELYETSFSNGPEIRIRALQLIALGTGSCDDEDLPRGVESRTFQLQDFLTSHSLRRLKGIVETALVRGRDEACLKATGSIIDSIIKSALRTGDFAMIDSIGDLLGAYVGQLSVASYHGKELADMLLLAVSSTSGSLRCSTEGSWLIRLGESLRLLVKESTQLLSSHPNGHIYKAIASLMVVDGYYLEAEPCVSCCAVAGDYGAVSLVALDDLRAEIKFTDKALFCRLGSRYIVSSISLKVGDPDRSRLVKRIDVYVSARVVTDAAELRSGDHAWEKLVSLSVSPGQTEVVVDLESPKVAANFMFEYAEFYGSSSASGVVHPVIGVESGTELSVGGETENYGDRMQCPRCSRQVTDRYGICRSCGENSYQCRACRNINYEVLDGFICNECGYCKHGRFDFAVSCAPAYDAEPIVCESDRKRAIVSIEDEAERVRCRSEELKRLRLTLIEALFAPPGSPLFTIESKASVDDNEEKRSDVPRPRADRRLLSDSVASLDASNMESLLRSLVGEDGGMALPVVIGGGVDRSESLEVASSLRDLAGQLIRERSHGNERILGEEESEEMVERTDTLGVPREERALGGQAGHMGTYVTELYGQDCKKTFTAMSRSVRALISTKRELSRFTTTRRQYKGARENIDVKRKVSEDRSVEHMKNMTATKCFGCAQACISRALPLLEVLVKQNDEVRLKLCSEGFAVLLLRCGSLLETDCSRDAARRLISTLMRDNPHTTGEVCAEIRRKLEFCVASYHSIDLRSAAQMELVVLEEFAEIEDSCWEGRLELIFRLLFLATDVAQESSAVSEYVILPCLRAACGLVQVPPGGNSMTTDIKPAGSRSDQVGNRSNNCDESVGTVSMNDESLDTALALEESGVGMPFEAHTADGAMELTVKPESKHDSQAQAEGEATPPNLDEADLELHGVRDTLAFDHELGLSSVAFGKWKFGKQDFEFWKERTLARGKCSIDVKRSVKVNTETGVSLRCCFRRWYRTNGYNGVQRDLDRSSRPIAGEAATSDTDVSWAFRLILRATSAEVRFETCALLETLCLEEESLSMRLLDGLLGVPLDDAPSVGAVSAEYFDLLERVLKPKSIRLYLFASGFMVRIASLIENEASRLCDGEALSGDGGSHYDLARGYVLKRLVSMSRLMLDAIHTGADAIRYRMLSSSDSNGSVVSSFVRSYLSLHSLISMRTKMTDDCCSALREMLSSSSYMFLKPAGEVVVSACVSELKLAHSQDDGEAISSLLDLLCEMLCPTKEDPSYSLILEKASSQEEFIRGGMNRDFYPSSEFEGPLMRDVKKKICQDLALMSLLEDDMGDFGLELLVAGSLINLDLSISAVYEHVWRNSAEALELQSTGVGRRVGLRRTRGAALPLRRLTSPVPTSSGHLSNSPMVVVYRISGLDGEATEPMVETLPSMTKNSADLEEEFKATEVLGRVGGLPIVLNLLSDVESWSDDAGVAARELTLRLLRASCEVASNRAQLAAVPNAISVLIQCVVSALNSAQESATAVESAESLSIAAEKILSEHAPGQNTASRGGISPEAKAIHIPISVRDGDFTSRFRVVLGHLAVVSSPIAEAALLHLLPYLMHGSRDAIELASEQFAVDWGDIDESAPYQRAANQLATVLAAWPSGWSGDSLSSLLLDRGVADAALDFIEKLYPMPKEDNLATWKASLELPGTCLALNVLRGLANVVLSHGEGETPSSRLRHVVVREGNVARLCRMEMAVSSNGVGSAAEELLETLCRDKVMREAAVEERRRIRAARKAAADVSRKAALAATQAFQATMGDLSVERAGKGGIDAVQEPSSTMNSLSLAMLLEVQDEIGPACVVCGDGFISRPSDALGIYVFTRRVKTGWKPESAVGSDEPDGDVAHTRNWQRRAAIPALAASPSLPDEDSPSRGRFAERSRSASAASASVEHCFTNVTHFNAIHLGCHREAARMDRSTRQPRDEWEGAALRNSQTKCNNVYPVMSPLCVSQDAQSGLDTIAEGQVAVAKSSYVAAVDFYFSRLASFSRTTLTQVSQTVHDIAHSLTRFGFGRPTMFAEHTHGGGPHSNVCLVPHMLQLAWHLLDSRSGKANCEVVSYERQLSNALSGDVPTRPCDLPLILALSLLFQDKWQWDKLANVLLKGKPQSRTVFDDNHVLLRAFAFTHLVQSVLKSQYTCSDARWRQRLSASICQDDTWLIDVCNEIANMWEDIVCNLDSKEDLLKFLERI